MIAYLKDFVRYNRNNEVGFGLLMVATAVTSVYVLIGLAAFLQGARFGIGWWAVIPVALWIVTVAHFIIRPIASKAYAKQ